MLYSKDGIKELWNSFSAPPSGSTKQRNIKKNMKCFEVWCRRGWQHSQWVRFPSFWLAKMVTVSELLIGQFCSWNSNNTQWVRFQSFWLVNSALHVPKRHNTQQGQANSSLALCFISILLGCEGITGWWFSSDNIQSKVSLRSKQRFWTKATEVPAGSSMT